MATRHKLTYNKQLKDVVTPKHLRETPIHNWLVFPHSYSYVLIDIFKENWQLGANDIILDPFCGAGTTLLAAKQLGIPAVGYDISPYAVFVSNVKTAKYDIYKLRKCWEAIKSKISKIRDSYKIKNYPDLVQKALSPQVINKFEKIEKIITLYSDSPESRDFFRLGLFAVMPFFSSAQVTGGWLKWVTPRMMNSELLFCYKNRIEMMLEQVGKSSDSIVDNSAYIGDVRYLPDLAESFSAIITSPPYPNRHDYTRVFGVELMYGFLDWEGTRGVRYQSLHSHPESKPIRPDFSKYIQPGQLTSALKKFRQSSTSGRITAMLEGYFVDMYCSLLEMYRVCKINGHAALVLGNAQYNGVQFLVDEIVADIGEQVGFTCEEILTARLRGNSAQQMKVFGKHPSRESIIILKKNI